MIPFAIFLLLLLEISASAQPRVPPDFRITEVALLPGNPTSLAFSPGGVLHVALLQGSILALDSDPPRVVASGFDTPTGIGFLGNRLYVSSRGQIAYIEDGRRVPILSGLPAGGHQNNSVVFGADGKLYFGMGSTCNACREADPRNATILRANPDGTDLEIYARGLRNSFDQAFHPATGDFFATDNGRDDLGPDEPPEELNHIVQGGHYGWPDVPPGPVEGSGTIPPIAGFPAHSSANGMVFYNARQFRGMENHVFLALFGNNPDQPARERKVVRVQLGLDSAGRYAGSASDFITNMTNPLDLVVGPDEALYVADFGARRIFRVTHANPELFRFSVEAIVTGSGRFSGIAIANPTTATTRIASLIPFNLSPRAQVARLIDRPLVLETTNKDVHAIAFNGTNASDSLDGFLISSSSSRELIFTEGRAQLHVGNRNTVPANLRLESYDPDGRLAESREVRLPAGQFLLAASPGRGHTRVTSDVPVSGIQRAAGEASVAASRSISVAATTAYVPHYVSGGGYTSSLKLVNPLSVSVSVSIEGLPTETLQPKASLEIPLTGSGFLKVTSSSPVFGHVRLQRPQEKADAIVPFMYEECRAWVIPHVVTGSGYFTGIAIVNPSDVNIAVTVEAFDASGNSLGRSTEQLAGRSRIARLLDELVTGARARLGGYAIISSTQPIFALGVYGDTAGRFLEAIEASSMCSR